MYGFVLTVINDAKHPLYMVKLKFVMNQSWCNYYSMFKLSDISTIFLLFNRDIENQMILFFMIVIDTETPAGCR